MKNDVVDLNTLLMGLKTVPIPIHHKKTEHWLLLEMNIKEKRWVFHDSYKDCLKDKGRMEIYKVPF